MSAATPRTRQISPRRPGPITVEYVDRPVIGDPQQVQRALITLQNNGLLVSASAIQPMPGADQRVFVMVRMLETAPTTAQPRQRWYRRPGVVATVAGVTITTCTGTAYGLYLLAQAAAQAASGAGPALVGLATVAALIWFVLGRSGKCCPGLHCPGCRCR